MFRSESSRGQRDEDNLEKRGSSNESVRLQSGKKDSEKKHFETRIESV